MKKGNTISKLVGFGYSFWIDYAKPIKELILEGGYATVDLGLEEFYKENERKRNKETETEGFLKHLGSCVFPDYKKLLEELDKNNLRPAYLRELLCFGSSYRYIQRQFNVIALGSINKQGLFFHVPILGSNFGLGERSLGVFSFRDEEYGFYCPEDTLPLKGRNRFLVLSKS